MVDTQLSEPPRTFQNSPLRIPPKPFEGDSAAKAGPLYYPPPSVLFHTLSIRNTPMLNVTKIDSAGLGGPLGCRMTTFWRPFPTPPSPSLSSRLTRARKKKSASTYH